MGEARTALAARTLETRTLENWISAAANDSPDHAAIEQQGISLSYRELDVRIAALAAALLSAGYRQGDRIATLAGNSGDHVVLFCACANAGLVLVPLSWRLSPPELAAQLLGSDPATLLIDEEFRALATQALHRAPRLAGSDTVLTTLGAVGVETHVPSRWSTREDARARLAPERSTTEEEPARPIHPDDPVLMIFTSGTTGVPKGVVLSHSNCVATNNSLAQRIELGPDDVVLSVMPQYHVGGWNIQPLLAWNVGATVILERRFEAAHALTLIAERRVTAMMGVPTNYLLMAQHPHFGRSDLSSVRRAMVGGAPVPDALARAWQQRGVPLTQGYGLTEASPNVLSLRSHDAVRKRGTVGTPYPQVEIAVADEATGEQLTGVARGELLVRGAAVFGGYFRMPEQTRAVLRDGWLHTGDRVQRDADGYYSVVGRLSDIFRSGGESVAPAEIETVLFEHPDVVDAAVIGVPDERWGEVGVAWLVLRPGAAQDTGALTRYLRAKLSHFKVPRHVRFVDEIPRSASAKVARAELHAEWAREEDIRPRFSESWETPV